MVIKKEKGPEIQQIKEQNEKPGEKTKTVVHAIGINVDVNMTRVYSAIQVFKTT